MVRREGAWSDRPGYVWDTYSPTPVMSAYLLAWVVSKYESAKSTSARGVKFEAFYSKASFMQHAADIGAKMLDHFEQKVFGIKYNLPKMDIIAVETFFETYSTRQMPSNEALLLRRPTILRPLALQRAHFPEKNEVTE